MLTSTQVAHWLGLPWEITILVFVAIVVGVLWIVDWYRGHRRTPPPR